MKHKSRQIETGIIVEVLNNPKAGKGTGLYRVDTESGGWRKRYVNFAEAYDNIEALALIYG